jgi:erythromycin esterase-like protein
MTDDHELSRSIAAAATPLPPDDDLGAVLAAIGDRRIVLLGEASHGSHEFYRLRTELTRRLVDERGFAAVAVEGDWPDGRRVDRYVRHTGDDRTAIDALAGFRRFPAWMWRNLDVVALVRWLHQRNRPHPARDRAGFYGLDLYSLTTSIPAVLEVLDRIDPAAAARARDRYACFDHAQDPQAYGMAARLGMRPACEDEVIAQLVELHARRRRAAEAEADDWLDVYENARVIADAERYYREMFASRIESWNVRDTHMADTLDSILAHLERVGSPGKVVVWAHNSHVGDARATELGELGELTIGQLARERHPGEVATIGFTTHHGEVAAAHDWDEPGRVRTVRPALPGSWEAVFHATELGRFLLPTRVLGGRRGPLGERRLERAIGVVYRPETERQSHYFHARIAAQFDAVIHIDETSAVVPLDPFTAARPAAGEPPETYPTGM